MYSTDECPSDLCFQFLWTTTI